MCDAIEKSTDKRSSLKIAKKQSARDIKTTDHRQNFGLTRFLGGLTMMVAGYGIALPLVPIAIRTLAPPVVNFTLSETTRLPDGRIRVTAEVEKRHCVFVSLGFAYHDDANHVWRVGYTTADQPPDTDTNRPSGIQTLGPWLIAAAPVVDAHTLTLSVRHRCGPFSVTTPLATIETDALPTK